MTSASLAKAAVARVALYDNDRNVFMTRFLSLLFSVSTFPMLAATKYHRVSYNVYIFPRSRYVKVRIAKYLSGVKSLTSELSVWTRRISAISRVKFSISEYRQTASSHLSVIRSLIAECVSSDEMMNASSLKRTLKFHYVT